MKKSRLLLFILAFSLPVISYQLSAYGQASNVGVGLTIRDTSGPGIGPIFPINNSGHPHTNVTFAYNVSDESNIANCTLIINNVINITNNSVSKAPSMNFFRLIEVPIGPYNWSINCTDIPGNRGEGAKRAVYVNRMSEFDVHTFNISEFDARNMTNFVMNVPSFGKINFSEHIDLSQGFDLDSFVNISFNKIALDSAVLSTLNKTATLQLVGLTFSNPRIAKDGIVCPDSICKKISYTGGVLTFNVSHFTSYEAEETPGEAAPQSSTGGGSSGGGGGGGGGGGPPAVAVVTDFTIDKSTLKVVLKQGQTKTETLSIKNTGTTIFDIKAYLSEIGQFKISPEEHEVTNTLQPNEERTIELVFKALEDEKPDIYPARITLKSPSAEKIIDTVVEVDSAEPLFDVDAEVLPESKHIFPGEELLLEVNLFNVRGFGRVDVEVEYSIKDFNGNVVATEHETIAVETQAKFSRSLLVPSDLRPGNYVALVKVTYGDSIGTSSDIFEVKAKTIRLYAIQIKDYKAVIFGGAAVMLVLLIAFSAYKMGYLKIRAPAAKMDTIKQLKDVEKAQKLGKELDALEKAYKSGFISEESYRRDKKRIEDKLKSAK